MIKYEVTFKPRKDRIKTLIFKSKKIAQGEARVIRLAGATNVRVKKIN